MGRTEQFNEAARNARPMDDTPQVKSDLHPEGKWAYDKYSGKLLSRDQAQAAADNPMIWKWAEWR